MGSCNFIDADTFRPRTLLRCDILGTTFQAKGMASIRGTWLWCRQSVGGGRWYASQGLYSDTLLTSSQLHSGEGINPGARTGSGKCVHRRTFGNFSTTRQKRASIPVYVQFPVVVRLLGASRTTISYLLRRHCASLSLCVMLALPLSGQPLSRPP